MSLHTMPLDSLAAIVDDLADAVARARRAADVARERHTAALGVLEHRLRTECIEGEAAVGRLRIYALERAPAGRAQVDKAALEEFAERLPKHLRPRVERVYPGVTVIREAMRKKLLPPAVPPLLIEAEEDLVLRTRKRNEES